MSCSALHVVFLCWLGTSPGTCHQPISSGDCLSAETLFSQQGAAILDSKAAPGQSCPLCQSTNTLIMSQSGTNTLIGVASEDYQLPGSTPLPDTRGSTDGKVAKPAYASSQLHRSHFLGGETEIHLHLTPSHSSCPGFTCTYPNLRTRYQMLDCSQKIMLKRLIFRNKHYSL